MVERLAELELQQRIHAFAQATLSPGARERDAAGVLARDLWTRCAEHGLLGLPVATEDGGAGLDPLTTALALEAFGHGCEDGGLVFSVCAHLLAVVVPIAQHGTEAQRRRWLPGLCDGTHVGVNAMTEASSGSDAFALTTIAERDGAGFRLRGRKHLATNAPIADVALVYALTDKAKGAHGGISAFVIAADAEGFARGPTESKMGLRTAQMSDVILDGVWVPDDQVIGGVGGGATVFRQSMEWERTLIAATHVGTMTRLLERVIVWARQRRSGGQPIGKYQAVAHRIADMKVRLEAARHLVRACAAQLADAREVAIASSAAKVFVSESLVESALDAVRVFGGHGFLADGDVERVLRDSVASLLYSGTNDVQRNIIARWLGL